MTVASIGRANAIELQRRGAVRLVFGLDLLARELKVSIHGTATVPAGSFKVMFVIFPKATSGVGAHIGAYGTLDAYFFAQQVRTPVVPGAPAGARSTKSFENLE